MTPIYAITLRQTPRRTELARQHWRECGLNVVEFPGIHAPTFGLATTKRAYPANPDGYVIQAGMVGCSLSHYMLWQHLHLNGIREALIIEDDAEFCEDFASRFSAVRDSLPADWQFCYVGHLRQEPANAWLRIERLTGLYMHGTQAYMVRGEALETMLATNQEIRTHIDLQLGENTLPHLRTYAVMPSLVGQRSGWNSTTDNRALTTVSTEDEMSRVATTKDELLSRVRQMLPGLGGWCDEGKATRLAEIVVEQKPAVCVEIGVFEGKSLFVIGMALRFNNAGRVWGVDAWDRDTAIESAVEPLNRQWWASMVDHAHFYRVTRIRVGTFGLGQQCELIRSRSDDAATLARFADAGVNLFHLDGNHSPGMPLRDVKAWFPKLAPNCTILLDDMGWHEDNTWPVMDAYDWLKSQGCEDAEQAIGSSGNCAVLRVPAPGLHAGADVC